jgi:hypothetical protein
MENLFQPIDYVDEQVREKNREDEDANDIGEVKAELKQQNQCHQK